MCNVNIDSVLFNSIRESSASFEEALEKYITEKTFGTKDSISLSSEKYQLNPVDEAFYMAQLQDTTPIEQKSTVEKLLALQHQIKYRNGQYVSSTNPDFIYKRVSNVISDMNGPEGQKDYYKFTGNSEKYKDNRAWGNLIDHVLESVILGKPVEQIKKELKDVDKEGTNTSVSDEVLSNLISIFKSYRFSNPNGIFLTQHILFNESEGIAGTADVIIVNEDGSIQIIDLKSSINPTATEYTTTSADGNEYTGSYSKRFKGKASKKDKHRAQLSLYAGLARSKDVSVSNTEILPIQILETNNGEVSAINREPNIKMSVDNNIQIKTAKDKNFVTDIKNKEKYDSFYQQIIKTLSAKLKTLKGKGNESSKYYIENLIEGVKAATSAER